MLTPAPFPLGIACATPLCVLRSPSRFIAVMWRRGKAVNTRVNTEDKGDRTSVFSLPGEPRDASSRGSGGGWLARKMATMVGPDVTPLPICQVRPGLEGH
jgi:hypothetical protein